MSLNQTGTAHASGSTPAITGSGALGSMFGWFNTAGGQNKSLLTTYQASTGATASRQNYRLCTDITAATNKIGALTENTSSSQNQALSTSAISTGAWHFCFALFSSLSTNYAGYDSGNKGNHTGTISPSGIDSTILGARPGDFANGINGPMAHVGVASRTLSDLELAYLGGQTGPSGGNPRYLGLNSTNIIRYWECASTETSTLTDQCGNENLAVTSLTAGASDPVVGTFWTATAQGNLSYTQGSAISSITFSSKYRQVAASIDYTVTLSQIGSAGTATSASGAAATASNQLTVADATNIAIGKYVKIGSGAFNLVLYVSGSSVLLATPQTWNNADTVTTYPVNSLALSGLSIAAGVFSGTPGAGAVGTYNNCLWRAANNTNANLIADSALFSITVASSGAAPSFTSGPTVNSTQTDGWTFGATPSASATWHIGAYLKGSTTPSVANIKAGTGTGFVSHISKAITGADTQTLTSLTFPFYDVYHVLSNGSGDSAAASELALFVAPAATKQFVPATVRSITAITKAAHAQVTVTGHGFSTGYWVEHFGISGMVEMNGIFDQITVIDANTYTLNNTNSTGFTTYTSGGSASWGQSVDANASVAIATGDVRIVDQATAPDGLPIVMQPDGSYSITAGQIARRQTFSVDCYDTSAGALIGSATEYVQNIPPISPASGSVLPALFLGANQTISQDLRGLPTDVQGDTLTVTASGLPSGYSVSSSTLTGSAATGTYPVTLTAANASGESTSWTEILQVGNVTPPNLFGLSSDAIINLLAGYYLNVTFSAPQDNVQSNGQPATANTAIAQNPAFGIPVAPNSTINVTLSSGNAPGLTVVTTSITKSSQLRQEEALNALQSYGVFKPFGVCQMGATDTPGQVYRFFRVPASAIVTTFQVMNDPNPTGSLYKAGFLRPNGGGLVVPGSDSILFPSLSLDNGRPGWADIFIPASANGPISIGNVGKRVWELLGLPTDPTTNPALASQDAFYDVALIAITPGQAGGYVALRMEYSRGPDRGLIAAAGVIGG